MNTLEIAEEIVEELEDDSVGLVNVQAWVKSNVGRISVLVGQTYSLDESGEYTPEITPQLAAVIKAAYYSRYYNNKSKNSLSNAYGQILSMKDDSSSVTFVNANEISKSFLAQAAQWKSELDTLVAGYKQNHSQAEWRSSSEWY